MPPTMDDPLKPTCHSLWSALRPGRLVIRLWGTQPFTRMAINKLMNIDEHLTRQPIGQEAGPWVMEGR